MLKLICFIFFFLLVEGAYSQSKQPACSSSGPFQSCFVLYTAENEDKYVAEWGDSNKKKETIFTSYSDNKIVDKFNGHGTATFRDGDKFVGEFKDGKPNGKGTLFDIDGSIINQGLWIDGYFKFSVFQSVSYKGQGTYTKAGNKYVGDWMYGMFNGQGTFTLFNGAKYVGEFKDDKYNGQGTLYASNGQIVVAGIWTNGNFVRSNLFPQSSLAELNASSCKEPEYPDASKRLEEEGNVQVLFSVEADGKVNAATGKSSGFRRLDMAAVRAVSDCQFKPAIYGGVQQQTWARMNFTFRIK